MLKTIEIAKALEIPTLNMHLLRGVYVTLPAEEPIFTPRTRNSIWTGLRRFRDKVTEAIGESGIKLCIENTDGYDQPFLRDALEVLLESPAVGLTLDVGHDHAIGGIDLPLILSHRDRLCHMHLHDAIEESVHLALGDGELDKERYLELAGDCGCRVVLETKTIEALGKSVMWINHWLNRCSEPDELWDVYDSERHATGRLHRPEGASGGEKLTHRRKRMDEKQRRAVSHHEKSAAEGLRRHVGEPGGLGRGGREQYRGRAAGDTGGDGAESGRRARASIQDLQQGSFHLRHLALRAGL